MRRLFRIVLAAAPLLAGTGNVFADEPCSGTLCDLFHGSSSETTAPAAPAAPHVMTVPTNPLASWFGHNDSSSDAQPAPAATQAQPAQQPTSYGNGFFHLGGGGVAARNSNQECSGTVCDLYHGHSSGDDAEPTTVQDINGTPRSSFDRVATPPVESVANAAPASATRPAATAYVSRPAPLPATTPSCAHSAKDPWSCYRR